MQLNVFSIFDKKAKCYSNPFFMPHQGQALRAFADLVADKNSAIAKHPEDYSLNKLAEYNDVAGTFVPLTPEWIANAVDFVENIK